MGYLYPAKAPRPPRPHEITNVTILERPPAGPRGKVIGGSEIVVAGRHVSYRPARQGGSQIAQWQTSSARYVMLANGTQAALERIIRCMP